MMSKDINKLGFSPEDIYVESLIDNKDGLTLLIRAGEGDFCAKVIFSHPRVYRNINEGDYLDIEEKRTYEGQGLYRIQQSKLIDWFHSVSLGIYENDGIQHYLLYTCDDCIEILSSEDPNIFIC